MATKTEAINFRHIVIRFDDESTTRYVMKLDANHCKSLDEIKVFNAAIEQAALSMFRRLRAKGRNAGDPLVDKRTIPRIGVGPKATAIISVWDGEQKSTGDSVSFQRAMLLMSKV